MADNWVRDIHGNLRKVPNLEDLEVSTGEHSSRPQTFDDLPFENAVPRRTFWSRQRETGWKFIGLAATCGSIFLAFTFIYSPRSPTPMVSQGINPSPAPQPQIPVDTPRSTQEPSGRPKPETNSNPSPSGLTTKSSQKAVEHVHYITPETTT